MNAGGWFRVAPKYPDAARQTGGSGVGAIVCPVLLFYRQLLLLDFLAVGNSLPFPQAMLPPSRVRFYNQNKLGEALFERSCQVCPDAATLDRVRAGTSGSGVLIPGDANVDGMRAGLAGRPHAK
jgi:hypothetical protein